MSSTDAYLDNSPPDPEASPISETVNEYLSALRPKVPKSTYNSHATSLKTLTRDINTTRPFSSLHVDEIGEHFINHYRGGAMDIKTVACAIPSISNYLAYHQRSHPEREKRKILNAVLTHDISTALDNELNNTHGIALDESDKIAIALFRDHLGKSAWGTLAHVITELIIDTWAQPGPIIELARGDFDAGRNEIWLAIPETFVISKYGLHQSWKASLSESTTRALETYIDYERGEQLLSNPMFTSAQGGNPSITRKTLYNHVTRAREGTKRRVPADHPRKDEVEASVDQITPNTLRRFAISRGVP